MSEYTDTILLECNRKQSPEYLSKIDAGNPAQWTNNLGAGVKLDIGDVLFFTKNLIHKSNFNYSNKYRFIGIIRFIR